MGSNQECDATLFCGSAEGAANRNFLIVLLPAYRRRLVRPQPKVSLGKLGNLWMPSANTVPIPM